MKKVLNYSITYKMETEIGKEREYKEEIYYTKKDVVTRYLNIIDGHKVFPALGIGNICSLKVNVNYLNCGTEEITGKINKFIAG